MAASNDDDDDENDDDGHGWVIGEPLMHGKYQERMEIWGMVCRTGSSASESKSCSETDSVNRHQSIRVMFS